MFLLLVAQFRSLIEPFNMIFSLSLILTGILGGLLLARQTFSTVSILAVVILTGMMMTVAVLMIDLVLRLRAEGMERDEAILTAAPIRLRPIVMTSLISIVVLIPVAFFPRTGIDAYAPLATVVIGGLTMGTVLALFVVPVLHTYTDDLTNLGAARAGGGDPRVRGGALRTAVPMPGGIHEARKNWRTAKSSKPARSAPAATDGMAERPCERAGRGP